MSEPAFDVEGLFGEDYLYLLDGYNEDGGSLAPDSRRMITVARR